MAGIYTCFIRGRGFPGGSVAKNPSANAGDLGLNPGLRRSLGEGDGNPLQYSCLGNPMDKGAWWATVHRAAKESDTTEHLSMHAHMGHTWVSDTTVS